MLVLRMNKNAPSRVTVGKLTTVATIVTCRIFGAPQGGYYAHMVLVHRIRHGNSGTAMPKENPLW
jgi:hypothetical protein